MLLGAGVVRHVIGAVGARVGKDRIGTEPLAQRHVAGLVAREAAVRPLVHEDREAELARADQHDGEHVGQRIGQQRNERDRSQNDRPGMGDERDALPFHALAQLGQLRRRHQLADRHAAG
jgi:hypothetical protein